jgi:predicted permease
LKRALAGTARVPALYALAAAGFIVILKITPPLAVMRPVGMLSDAALPAMLLILGMQLKRAVAPNRPVVVATAVVLSLFHSRFRYSAIVLATLLGLSGSRQGSRSDSVLVLPCASGCSPCLTTRNKYGSCTLE